MGCVLVEITGDLNIRNLVLFLFSYIFCDFIYVFFYKRVALTFKKCNFLKLISKITKNLTLAWR